MISVVILESRSPGSVVITKRVILNRCSVRCAPPGAGSRCYKKRKTIDTGTLRVGKPFSIAFVYDSGCHPGKS